MVPGLGEEAGALNHHLRRFGQAVKGAELALDADQSRYLVAVMRRLFERGATLVIVTHELDALADIVTRTVVVRGGGIQQDCAPAQLAAGEQAHTHHSDEGAAPPSTVPTTIITTKGGPR